MLRHLLKSLFYPSVPAPRSPRLAHLILRVLCLTSVSLFCAGAANAQQLGPDDVLSVSVLGYPELSADSVTVSQSSTINLPVAGQISVVGKTPTQLSREIARRLNVRAVNPEVTVSLKQAGPRRVFVLGGVAKPGVYDIKPGWRVSEIVAAAGGVQGRLDETSTTLARPSQKPLKVDLTLALGNSSSPQNYRVHPGDVLVVTLLDPQIVTVSGDVTKPDVYPLRRGKRLLDVLVAAGGLKQTSQNTRGYLLRKGQKTPLDLPAAMQYSDYKANIALMSGDLVMLEAIAPLNITVNGLVRNPGNYPLPEGSGVLQAIAQAGGQTTTSEKTVVTVRRGDAVLPVNVTRAIFDPTSDVPLRNGDLVQLSEPQIIRVQVTGQVRTPGELRISPNATVLDALAQAGGLSITAEAARISVVRDVSGRQKALEINAVSLLEGSDLRQNTRLQEGDVVSVTNVRSQLVFISGEVTRPGAYDLKEGEGVPELVARAGGPTAAARLRQVQIERGGKTQTFDALRALREGENASTFTLREGDFVVVPENTNRVMVMQEVNRPGYVLIPEDRELTVGEAMSLAGGPRERAKLNEVLIFRQGPTGLTNRVVRLDKLEKDELGFNEKLKSGDILYVPQGRPSRSRSALDTIVSSVGTLRFLGVY
jgi:protein involved in polysaccharide export with SLBB domain